MSKALEVSKARLDMGAWNNLDQWKVSLPMGEDWIEFSERSFPS